MSNLCSSCNTENVDEAKFCRKCGRKEFQRITTNINQSNIKENPLKNQREDISTIALVTHFIFTYIIIYILALIPISILSSILSLNGFIILGAMFLNLISSFYLTKIKIKKYYMNKQQQPVKSIKLIYGFAFIIMIIPLILVITPKLFNPHKINTTEIIWQDSIDVETTHVTWPEAKKYCEKLNLDGYSNWRLPTHQELDTIMHYGWDKDNYRLRVLIYDKQFTYYAPGHYWSSSSNVTNNSSDFNTYIYSGFFSPYSEKNYLRCVRN